MSAPPKVSIVTITYNHEKYIRETLDCFVKQKTNFGVEIIVADDCSTDKTPKIIEEYAEKHPGKFKPILRKKNVGAIANSLDSLRTAKGEYIALCEGDDYWTDPNKLQLQADFLDKHPDYAICFHPVKVFFEGKQLKDEIFPSMNDEARFTTSELLRWNFIQTNSVMYRRQNYDNLPNNILPLDWYYHLYHAKKGKIGFINKVMAVYRRHEGGIWWDAHNNIDKLWQKYGAEYFTLYQELLKLHGNKAENRKAIYDHIFELLTAIVNADKNLKTGILKDVLKQFPDASEAFIIELLGRNQDHADAVLRLRQKADAFENSLMTKEHEAKVQAAELKQLHQELDSIRNSRSWKYSRSVAGLKNKIIPKKKSEQE
jgi:glycosyltransferase involved in cell wall biosynthesis